MLEDFGGPNDPKAAAVPDAFLKGNPAFDEYRVKERLLKQSNSVATIPWYVVINIIKRQ